MDMSSSDSYRHRRASSRSRRQSTGWGSVHSRCHWRPRCWREGRGGHPLHSPARTSLRHTGVQREGEGVTGLVHRRKPSYDTQGYRGRGEGRGGHPPRAPARTSLRTGRSTQRGGGVSTEPAYDDHSLSLPHSLSTPLYPAPPIPTSSVRQNYFICKKGVKWVSRWMQGGCHKTCIEWPIVRAPTRTVTPRIPRTVARHHSCARLKGYIVGYTYNIFVQIRNHICKRIFRSTYVGCIAFCC